LAGHFAPQFGTHDEDAVPGRACPFVRDIPP
jgi:hypothetical protein